MVVECLVAQTDVVYGNGHTTLHFAQTLFTAAVYTWGFQPFWHLSPFCSTPLMYRAAPWCLFPLSISSSQKSWKVVSKNLNKEGNIYTCIREYVRERNSDIQQDYIYYTFELNLYRIAGLIIRKCFSRVSLKTAALIGWLNIWIILYLDLQQGEQSHYQLDS